MGRHGMVASAHYLASMAGARVLMEGGNAVDGAVAVAAALNVVEPYMSGLGGDGIMAISPPGASAPVVLDYSGPVPLAATLADYTRDEMTAGPKAALVPGSAGGWFAALERYGSLPAERVFADAIRLAEEGAPVSFRNVEFFGLAAKTIQPWDNAVATFMPGGAIPRAGSVLRQPNLARAMRRLAAGGSDEFYGGALGQEVVGAVQAAGGVLSMDDLAAFRVAWQSPLSVTFRGDQIFIPPPPCAGFQCLQTIAMLDDDDLASLGHNSAEYLHLLFEAIKLASADRIAYTMTDVDHEQLLQPAYLQERRRLIGDRASHGPGERFDSPETRAAACVRPGPARRASEHTTHFAVVDGDGMAVNVTQSLGNPFGSGFMAGETGILLNNFLYWTDQDPASPNAMAPGKQMENCMSPAQVYRDGRFMLTMGTPGSWGIPQTQAQAIMNVLAFGMNVQEAIEAPRIRLTAGLDVSVEGRIPAEVVRDLEQRGHRVTRLPDFTWLVGGMHGIHRDPESGVLSGGADPRRDGYAVGW
jgi:gamma-glutamyltranspeptidase/glutathione hydrolase